MHINCDCFARVVFILHCHKYNKYSKHKQIHQWKKQVNYLIGHVCASHSILIFPCKCNNITFNTSSELIIVLKQRNYIKRAQSSEDEGDALTTTKSTQQTTSIHKLLAVVWDYHLMQICQKF